MKSHVSHFLFPYPTFSFKKLFRWFNNDWVINTNRIVEVTQGKREWLYHQVKSCKCRHQKYPDHSSWSSVDSGHNFKYYQPWSESIHLLCHFYQSTFSPSTSVWFAVTVHWFLPKNYSLAFACMILEISSVEAVMTDPSLIQSLTELLPLSRTTLKTCHLES